MAIDDDVKISINLNKLVEARAKLLTQYEDYSKAVSTGEYLDGEDIDRIAVKLRETITWDALWFMTDSAILDYMGLKNPNKPNYGERSIETIELTMEKERKEREKEFKKNFEMVKLESSSWTIEVPVRKK
tara:strand:+ start:1059 stop:1448 length:390 start_codon:yes stop_codon:yes gene_type:complete